MNPRRKAAIAGIGFLLVLPVAGCATDNDDEFREDYNAAVKRLSKINTDIGSATAGNQSNAEIAADFNQIADTAERTRSDLAALEPPEDASDEFDELLGALQRGIDDLRSVATAAESDDPQQANRAVRDLARTGRAITAAENALKKAVDG